MKTSFFALLLLFCCALNGNAQELRLSANVQVYGEINHEFVGPGAGIESPAGKKISLNFDVNVGFGQIGRATAFRAAGVFYPAGNNAGFYVGPSLKYIRINERGPLEIYDNALFAVGFDLGLKAPLSDRTQLFLNLSPHKTVGGNNERDVAGISGQVGLSYRL